MNVNVEIKRNDIRKRICKVAKLVDHHWGNPKFVDNRIYKRMDIIRILMRKIANNLDHYLGLLPEDLDGVAESALEGVMAKLSEALIYSEEYNNCFEKIPF